MKISRYILPVCLLLFACKQKNGQQASDAKAHTDTIRTSDVAATNPVPNAQLIVPDKSIGETSINQPGSSVFDKLGKPDVSDAAMGKGVAVWYPDHNKKGYSTHMYLSTNMGNDDITKVKVIRVTSPTFKITNHLYTGVLIVDAEKTYKLTMLGTFKIKGSERSIYDDIAAGIAFDIDRSGNIIGIAVHEKGKSPLNAYMAWFGEVKPAE